jgi:hypothetical protein
MFAQLLKLTEMQALLIPAAGTFVIPKKLDVCLRLFLHRLY